MKINKASIIAGVAASATMMGLLQCDNSKEPQKDNSVLTQGAGNETDTERKAASYLRGKYGDVLKCQKNLAIPGNSARWFGRSWRRVCLFGL